MAEATQADVPIEPAPAVSVVGEVLVDAATGETLAVEHPPELVSRAAACVTGAVLEGGLGFGATRDALLAAPGVTSVETVEKNAAVVDLYIAIAAATSDRSGASEQVPVGDAGGAAAEDPNPITEVAIEDRLATAVALDAATWDSALLDLGETVLYDDTAFTGNLKAAFPRLGQRIVVITDNAKLELPGFARGLTEQFGNTYLHAFDRFEPSAGLGVLNPHGSVYLPGYGWKE
jgi:hypothetical protein